MIDLVRHQRALVEAAEKYLFVREEGRNRGTEVERFLSNVGLPPGQPWCAAGLYTTCLEAAVGLGGATSCPKTGSATGLWLKAQKAGLLTFRPQHVLEQLVYPQPGDLFVRVRTGQPHQVANVYAGNRRKGHCGLVTGLLQDGLTCRTVEFNTDLAGDREGDGVYARFLKVTTPELVGFVRLSPPRKEGER